MGKSSSEELKEYHRRKALGQEITCPTCKGKQHVVLVIRGTEKIFEETCPGCLGTGTVNDANKDHLD